MANEKKLKDRWGAIFIESAPYKQAQVASEVAKASRKARYNSARRGARTAFDMADLTRREREEEGTAGGEAQLAGVKAAHDNEVRDYIQRTRDQTQRRLLTARPSVGGSQPSFEPDFGSHYPYMRLGPDVLSFDKFTEVDAAKKRAAMSGTPWTAKDDISAAMALNSPRMEYEADQRFNAQIRPSDLESPILERRNAAQAQTIAASMLADRQALEYAEWFKSARGQRERIPAHVAKERAARLSQSGADLAPGGLPRYLYRGSSSLDGPGAPALTGSGRVAQSKPVTSNMPASGTVKGSMTPNFGQYAGQRLTTKAGATFDMGEQVIPWRLSRIRREERARPVSGTY